MLENTSPPFVHLRVHSEYSVVDGLVRIPALVSQAVTYQQPAVALTDLSNVFGLIKFYRAARGKGIKPIAGCDLWVHRPSSALKEKSFRILVLVKNHQGYLNLCELLTKAYRSQGWGRAEIQLEWLREHNEGLIVLSGARDGEIGLALESANPELAEALARQWAEWFPERFFIELQRAGREGDERYVQAALNLASRLSLPVVATHPVQFIEQDDFEPHEVRVCIAQGEQLANPSRVKRFTRDQYFQSSSEMHEKFADIPSALANTVAIAQACNLSLELGTPKLPLFPTPNGESLEEFLILSAQQGLDERMVFLYPDEQERAKHYPIYKERLDIECQTINQMGFPGYFLIVQEFIQWAKRKPSALEPDKIYVPVGPGRGSGAGSLVAFSLGITDIDPLRYDLLFERFLNPERVSMPDFDIDFCQDNREFVIEHVRDYYGVEAVSQIATFGTLGAKAVIRDVGRVLELPYTLCDTLSKMIPHNPADPWSLERALKEEPSFAERYENDEEVRQLINLARPLEGLTRNVGMHAGGVLIAPGKLTDFCPLYCQPGQSDIAVSQYDKDDVEAVGLVKFDFLGLRNLTILDWAVKYVQAYNEGELKQFDVMKLALTDLATYQLLTEGNTTAVFQLESRGMKELLKKLKPSNFEDIIAVLALYRPGPLGSGMVEDFVDRKHGRARAEYFTKELEPVLKSTYGVIVYQEQVMLISQIIGGYTLGGADMLRRAMGKKKPEEMAQHREIFQKGAVEKGFSKELATQLFDLMEKFAEYGFNKSHTAAYALIAYHTAWLKAHHPAEFMAATLSSDMDDTDKVQIFWSDTLANGVAVLPPNINESAYRFEPVRDEHFSMGKPPKTIRYGLGAVKGVGEEAVESIIRERVRNGPYTDLFDFCKRVDKQRVNRRTLEALIKAGAFDTLNDHRAQLLASVNVALDAAEQQARDLAQNSLFGEDDISLSVSLVEAERWDLPTQLSQEKLALGFFFSAHLFDAYASEVRQFIPLELVDVLPSKELQWVAGIILGVRTQLTRRGKMLFVQLDDGTEQKEVSVFAELFEANKALLKEDKLVVMQVKVSNDEYSGGLRLVADSVLGLEQARAARARVLRLTVTQNTSLMLLSETLTAYRSRSSLNVDDSEAGAMSGVRLEFYYSNQDAQCVLLGGEDWRVMPSDECINDLIRCLMAENVELVYG